MSVEVNSGAWWLYSITRGEAEVPSGSPVPLAVRRGAWWISSITRSEVEVPGGSQVSLEVR